MYVCICFDVGEWDIVYKYYGHAVSVRHILATLLWRNVSIFVCYEMLYNERGMQLILSTVNAYVVKEDRHNI